MVGHREEGNELLCPKIEWYKSGNNIRKPPAHLLRHSVTSSQQCESAVAKKQKPKTCNIANYNLSTVCRRASDVTYPVVAWTTWKPSLETASRPAAQIDDMPSGMTQHYWRNRLIDKTQHENLRVSFHDSSIFDLITQQCDATCNSLSPTVFHPTNQKTRWLDMSKMTFSYSAAELLQLFQCVMLRFLHFRTLKIARTVQHAWAQPASATTHGTACPTVCANWPFRDQMTRHFQSNVKLRHR